MRRQRPYRRSPRSRSSGCCSARAKRSSHRCRDKRCSVSSHPAATRVSTPVAATPGERQPRALASHRESRCEQAPRRVRQLRKAPPARRSRRRAADGRGMRTFGESQGRRSLGGLSCFHDSAGLLLRCPRAIPSSGKCTSASTRPVALAASAGVTRLPEAQPRERPDGRLHDSCLGAGRYRAFYASLGARSRGERRRP